MKWYDRMIEKAKMIIRQGEPLQPVFFLKGREGIDVIPLDEFADDKNLMSELMRQLVRTRDPDEYLFISEAYVKMIDAKDGGDVAVGKLLVDGALSVSQVPSSKECISILHGNRKSERVGTVIFERKRSIVEFKPTQWSNEGELGGRLAGLREQGQSPSRKGGTFRKSSFPRRNI
jgi:hypothetical protein